MVSNNISNSSALSRVVHTARYGTFPTSDKLVPKLPLKPASRASAFAPSGPLTCPTQGSPSQRWAGSNTVEAGLSGTQGGSSGPLPATTENTSYFKPRLLCTSYHDFTTQHHHLSTESKHKYRKTESGPISLTLLFGGKHTGCYTFH